VRRVSLLLLGLGMSTPCRAQVPRLLTTDSLAGWLRAPSGSEVVLLDVREPWVSYLQDHLPGAAWLNVETLRATEGELPFQLLPPSHYAELFRRLGLAPETPVVVYSAGDQLDIDATFVAWLLASAGATRVYLLDGGYAKRAAAHPTLPAPPVADCALRRRAVPPDRGQSGRRPGRPA